MSVGGVMYERKNILPEPLDRLIMVVCPDVDRFHNHLFLQYIIISRGEFIDEPTYEMFLEIRKDQPDIPIEVTCCICKYCRARGVKGISHFDHRILIETKVEKETKDENSSA